MHFRPFASSCLLMRTQSRKYNCRPKPRHLICFKNWSVDMVKKVLLSAMNLKCMLQDTHGKKLSVLNNCKVTTLLEVNEPTLSLAVSKAASLLGAQDNIIVDNLIWDHDYLGRIFSLMADVIFVSTSTHMCLQRFSEQSSVPVLCMRSRTHSTIQALSTVMAIQEEYGCLDGINISYIGSAGPVLNSYLLLCPMLNANIKFKCCCDKAPVSPLLHKAGEKLCEVHNTDMKACASLEDALQDAKVVISGPTTLKKDKVDVFKINLEDIKKSSCQWIFFHSCPRGQEVKDDLFCHTNSRTFNAFENMQFIAAALMANSVKGHLF